MSEDLNFNFDEINDVDIIDEATDNEEILKERHIKFGVNEETIKILENLVQKIKFPGAIFLDILDKIQNMKGEVKEIKDKLHSFYSFLEKYSMNLKYENLTEVINLANDYDLDIFSFWSKKLSKIIFDNLLEKRQQMKLNEFLHNFSIELIENGYEINNVFQLICELVKNDLDKIQENKLIIESILTILKTYKIEKSDFYDTIHPYIKKLNEDSPKYIYAEVCKNQNKLEDLSKDELIKEIEKRNPEYFTKERKNNLISQLAIINEIYERRKDLLTKERLKQWLKNELPSLKDKYEKNKFEISAKILAVISIANEVFTTTTEKKGYKLRDIQIMSVLLFINKNDEKGLIEEISTGEGKSTIICALATFFALIGKKVDIVTSALNLAKRDAEELKDFYGLFNLTVDYVENSNPDPYKEDIIYGSFLEYEGDYLRQLTQKNKIIRGNRKFEVLIVDEIDNLFIDNIDGSTRLVYSTMGYQFLTPIFVNIFFVMQTYEKQFEEFFNENIIEKNMEEKEKNYFLNLIKEETFRDKNIYPILKSFTYDFIRKLYGMTKFDENDENEKKLSEENEVMKEFFKDIQKTLHLPLNLRDIFNNQLENWVDNAYKALFNFHENRDYVVSNGIIAPVDRENTGEVEKTKVYRDGLHRMLEIKHHLRIRDETLNHTFLSHISYFKKFNNNNKLFFYGMTGTLGDKNTLEIFKDETKFNSETLYIPTYKRKRFVEFPAILCKDKNTQIKKICEEIKFHFKNKRKILVINNSIEDAKNLKKYLMEKENLNEQVGLYTRDDDKKQMETIEHNYSIILATNLAGRGTDIKTNEIIEENGGLHIILTSVPSNLRIEKQNYGRTSRQGNKGSGQMIISQENLNFDSIIKYKDDRDKKEKERLNNITKIMDQTLFKDKLFNEYITLLEKYNIDYISSEDIDERWGTFLDTYINDKEDINNEIINKIEKEFENFKNNLKKDLDENEYVGKIKNSFLNISYGWENYKNSPKEQMEYNKRAKELERFSFAAYYYDARNLIINSKIGNYPIEEINKNLKEALKILELILEESINVCYNQFNERKQEYDGSEILQQMLNREHLVNSVIDQIKENIKVIEKFRMLKKENEKKIRNIEIICKNKDIGKIFENKEENEIEFLEKSGLYEIYELDLKQKYKWYEKLFFFIKIPLEFLFGLALILFTPGIGAIVGSFFIGYSIASCFNYFLTIHSGALPNFKDYFFNLSLISSISRKIRYFIGKDIFSRFFAKKNQRKDKSKAISDNSNQNNNPNFINESDKLNKIKQFSKEKIENYIKEKFRNIISEKKKEIIKYLLCFDDYLKEKLWVNTIKNKIIEHYKNDFKKDFKDKEEEIINILKNGYENDAYDEAINNIETILQPIIEKSIQSLGLSLDKFMEIKKYDKENGLNSLEHLIRYLNPKEIDDKLAQEIVKEFKKYNIINNDNNENNYKFNIQIKNIPTLNFIIQTDLKNIRKETKDFSKFNLMNISRKPIINDDMDDKIDQFKKTYNESAKDLENRKAFILKQIFLKTIDLIIQSFPESKTIYENIEEFEKLISEKIINRLNKKIYSKLDSEILGDIAKSSFEKAEKQIFNNLKIIFKKKRRKYQ